MADTTDTTISLITLAELTAYVQVTGTSEDTFLSLLIDQVSRAVNDYTGRYLLQKTWTEYHDGNGENQLILAQYPISSVTSIYDDIDRVFTDANDLYASDEFFIETQSGIIRLNWDSVNFQRGRANVRVIYVAGYALASVPGAVKLAVKRWCGVHYKKYKSGRHEVQSESIGDRHTTYFDKEIPNDVALMLAPYVRAGDSPSFSYA